MADKTPVKKTSKPKKVATHPKYSEMVVTALGSLKERGGSSRQALLKYLMANFSVGEDSKVVNSHLKIALRNGVTKETLKQSKGTGAAGSFKLGEKPKVEKKPKAKKPVTETKAKKPKAKKPETKKPATKKTPVKKAKKPTAAAKKPATKKATKPKKTPVKKAKVAKSPAKKTKTAKPKKEKATKK